MRDIPTSTRRADRGARSRGIHAAFDRLPAVCLLTLVCSVNHTSDRCRAADGEHLPSKAVAGLDVAPGLEATLFASEPMLLSPTNIDVDDRGRVWVCEVVNYRARAGTRREGDRILILEDTDGDGKADKSTVFYQGRDVDSAMGICVLGDRVIVSASPNILLLTDTDGDGKADKKELLFTKTGNPQHDHSAHKFVFGPDGRLYWNFGNEGKSVHDRDGKPVIDLFGRTVNDLGNPYRGGMAFRCHLDGRNFEVLAHNFRNNYELAVDSFGGLWQSDNDDDGNRGVRINFLLEYGNYGYRDEMTGASWQTPRTNAEREIPRRHWHQDDPGVVPNLLVTGAGAPTGIVVYEGDLLPAQFRGQLIHCDPGPNVVRSYPVENDGAGYKARIVNLLKGSRDNWFRPSDICVAPDGSLLVADWYDPGVGGHRMGDITRGRIFRIAPPGSVYRVPAHDFTSIDGAVRALLSPNLATRYLAWTSLANRIAEAEPALQRLVEQSVDPRARARALWLLGSVGKEKGRYVAQAAADRDPDLRMMALRLARRIHQGVGGTVERLAHDPSPQVRRECAIALRNANGPQKAHLWSELAAQYDGRDRWYLESLGIGAEGAWEACFDAWLKESGANWNTPAGRDIVWRSRSSKTPELLAAILESPSTPANVLPRYLRAFDFLQGPTKEQALVHLAFSCSRSNPIDRELIQTEAIGRLDPQDVLEHPAHLAALKRVVDAARGTYAFVTLIERFGLTGYGPDLWKLALSNPTGALCVRTVAILLGQREELLIADSLNSADAKKVDRAIRALATAEDPRAVPLLAAIVDDEKRPLEVRRQAVRAVSRTVPGAKWLLKQTQARKLDAGLRDTTSAALYASASDSVRAQALKLFPLPPSADVRPLPPMSVLQKLRGDPQKGKIVFATIATCAKCHVVNGQGLDVGPNLSEIGGKLSRPALYESILFPSAGISHNFAAYTLVLQNGNVVSGILISRTPEAIVIKGTDAILRTYKTSEVDEIKEQTVSLMPADLQKTMTADDLVNLVEYLSTLKPKVMGNGRDRRAEAPNGRGNTSRSR